MFIEKILNKFRKDEELTPYEYTPIVFHPEPLIEDIPFSLSELNPFFMSSFTDFKELEELLHAYRIIVGRTLDENILTSFQESLVNRRTVIVDFSSKVTKAKMTKNLKTIKDFAFSEGLSYSFILIESTEELWNSDVKELVALLFDLPNVSRVLINIR